MSRNQGHQGQSYVGKKNECVCVQRELLSTPSLVLVVGDEVLILNFVERDVHMKWSLFLLATNTKTFLITNRGTECKTICIRTHRLNIIKRKERKQRSKKGFARFKMC